MGNPDVIPARVFARQGDVWRRLTPALENYVRWMNSHLSGFGAPVHPSSHPSRRALIAEAAFNAVDLDLKVAEEAARDFVERLPRGESARGPLQQQEELEIQQLRNQLEAYTRTAFYRTAPLFHPSLPGCGIIDSTHADVLLGSELIEVKAVERSFRSSDLRQLLTYCAMGYAADVTIDSVTLLNPRLGQFHSRPTDELGPDLGAASWVELMKDVIDAMSRLEASG